MSNFTFLQHKWPKLYRKLQRAESRATTEPVSSASYSRLALEHIMHLLYDHEDFKLPEDIELFELMTNDKVRRLVHPSHLDGLHVVRKVGNNASHYGRSVSPDYALISLRHLFSFLKWFAYMYDENCPDLPPVFDKRFVPGESPLNKLKHLEEEHEKEYVKLRSEIAQLIEDREKAKDRAYAQACTLKAFREEVQARQREVIEIYSEYTDEETRLHLQKLGN